MGKLKKEPTLKEQLSELLAAKFPGSEFIMEAYDDRIGGTLIWDKFAKLDQVARQEMLYAAIRNGIELKEQSRLSLIITITHDELNAITNR